MSDSSTFPRTKSTDSHNPFVAAGFWWLSLGCDLVPVYPRSKYIVKGYGANQARIVHPAALKSYCSSMPCNLAVCLGGLAGLMCLDFDDAALYHEWRRGPGAAVETHTEQTGRGFHVFFAYTAQLYGKPAQSLEVKQSGVMMIAPSVNENGFAYRVVESGGIASFRPEYLPPPFFSLSDFAPLPTKPRAVLASVGTVVERIKTAYTVRGIAAQHLPDLAKWLATTKRYVHCPCPFHDDKKASFWLDLELNLWGCYGASCPARGTHDLINLYALAKNLSVQDAITELAKGLV